MTAQITKGTGAALSQAEALDLSASRDEEWQQPALLPTPSRSRSRSGRPSERTRQIGLVGIAQARAALEEASKRAAHSGQHRAA